jgi:hypothetical protein
MANDRSNPDQEQITDEDVRGKASEEDEEFEDIDEVDEEDDEEADDPIDED